MLAPLIADHLRMGCAGILAMPNTKPPVAKVFDADDILSGAEYWSVEFYLQQLKTAGGDKFSVIIAPLYLTSDTTPHMIEAGAKSGLLKACKYYPPHGTTGAEHGWPFEEFLKSDIFRVIEETGITLCVHGEEHGLQGADYFDREQTVEQVFYTQRLPRLLEKYPNIRLSCEHLTTKAAVDFVIAAPQTVGGTITPQHLLYTVGDLLQGLKYHLYCLPLLKFAEDRAALRAAVTDPSNTKFFAGTDSAPHTDKLTPCGCAAGCYTGGIAPQLYAQAFEAARVDLSSDAGVKAFKNFLCLNGPAFYGLDVPEDIFTLEKMPQEVKPLRIGNKIVEPLPLGLSAEKTSVTIPWSITGA